MTKLDPMYPEAVEFARKRIGFTRDRFQAVLRVGFVKRDVLLLDLVDTGVVKVSSNDRDYFLTIEEQS